MSGGRVAGLEEVRERVRAASVRLGRVLFGDRVGFVVFLAAVLWCVALWRIGIFITDTLTVANALANVADGHLAIRQTPYSLTIGSQPGIVQVGDTVFGRNYGHVLLAVPLVWLLEGLSLLFEPRVLLAGGWSLGLIVLAVQLRRLTGNAAVATVGSGLALVVFLANVAVATPVPEALLALIGLQLSTILVAGLLASTMYRLVTRFHGRRVGVVAGVAVLVATPVGFWASIPKRHLITATVAVVALFCFAVSRDGTGKRQLRARILSYVVIGLLTTVHPFEAFFLFVVLVPLDLLTAPSNRPRAVLAVAGVFFLSLLPFFVLNTLISGNPVKSPRLLSGYAGSLDVPTPTPPDEGGASGSGGGSSGETGSTGGSGASGSGTGGSATGGASGTGGSGSTSSGILAVVASYLAGFVSGMIGFVGEVVGLVSGMVGFTVSVAEYAVGWVDQSLAVLSEPDRLSQTFVRSGQLPSASLAANDFEAVELTLLESFPLVAAFVWLPVSVVEHLRTAVADAGVTSPAQQTDLLAGGFAVVFTLVYLPRLPLHTQVTLRYILPVMPLLLYGLIRLSAVNETIVSVPKWLVGSYLTLVGVGSVLFAVGLTLVDPAIGEAMQLHALVGLATAGLAVVAFVCWPIHTDRRVLAVGLSLPAAATTIFLLFSRIEYFSYQMPNATVRSERYALDVVRVLGELLPVFPV